MRGLIHFLLPEKPGHSIDVLVLNAGALFQQRMTVANDIELPCIFALRGQQGIDASCQICAHIFDYSDNPSSCVVAFLKNIPLPYVFGKDVVDVERLIQVSYHEQYGPELVLWMPEYVQSIFSRDDGGQDHEKEIENGDYE